MIELRAQTIEDKGSSVLERWALIESAQSEALTPVAVRYSTRAKDSQSDFAIPCLSGLAFEWISLLAICFCPSVAFAAAELSSAHNLPNAEQIITSMADNDAIFEAGCAVSGTLRSVDSLMHVTGGVSTARSWRMTFDKSRIAYLLEVEDYRLPKFENLRRRNSGQREADSSRYIMRVKEWGFWGNDISGVNFEELVFRITRADKAEQIGTMTDSLVFGPDDVDLTATPHSIVWALGRRFVEYIDEIEHVDKQDSLIAVSARGRKIKGRNGTWKLKIDPDANWMVRYASFHAQANPDAIDLEMRNDDVQRSGPYCVPRSARINHWGPLEVEPGSLVDTTCDVTVSPKVEQFDTALYTQAESRVANNEKQEFTLHDFRNSPMTITEPNRPPGGQSENRSIGGRLLIYALNIAGILIVLVLLWLRKRSRTERSST